MAKGRKKKAKPARLTAAERLEQRAYEAALSTPLRRSPVGADHSADGALANAQRTLLDWGRYLDENHDLASGVLDEIVKSVIGPAGIVTLPEPRRVDGSIDQELGADIMRLWKRWTRRVDVTGQLSWARAQRLTCRAWARDGEQFIQHVAGRARGFPFSPDEIPYRLELLESEMVPFDLSDNGWRQGVRFDEWWRPLQYAVYLRHPGDSNIGMAGLGGRGTVESDIKPVDRDVMIHLMDAKRWRATRGVSRFAATIARIYDIKDLEESERIKNRALSNWIAAIQKSPELAGQEDSDSQGRRHNESFQGMLLDTLAPGEQLVGVGPDYPVTGMPDHIADQIRRIAAGMSTGYSAISRRWDGNYSAQRQELVEMKAHYEIREDDLVSQVVRAVYERWLEVAVLDGQLVLGPGEDSLERAKEAQYIGPATPWIDPAKEISAFVEAIDNGITSLDRVRIRSGNIDMIGKPAPRAEPAPDPASAPRPALDLVPSEEDAA